MSETTKRLQWLDVLKFFGITLVMFGHIYTNKTALNWLYTFHVPLFFIAGGNVFRPRKISEDLKKRAFRILVPYFLFGIIMVLYYSFLERPFRDVDMNITDCFLGLLIGDMKHLEFHSHLWFLPCYFITTVLYNVLYKLLKPLGCRLVCAAATLAYVFLPIPSLPWGIDRMCSFLGLFALGNFIAEKGLTEKADKLPTWIKLVSAALLIAASVLFSYFRLTKNVMWIVCAIVGTAGFAFLSMALEKVKVLTAVGKMTIVILCIHGPIYRILIKVSSMITNISSDAIRANIFAALGVTAVTLAICCVLYIVLDKLLPWSIGHSKNNKPKKEIKNV